MQVFIYGEKRPLPAGYEEFVDPRHAAIISIDMHEGHLSEDEQCPCPAPRAREIVKPINAFHAKARALGVPVVHVRSVLRRGGVDDVRGIPSAWRKTFPLYVGPIPNADEHAIEGTRWTRFVTDVDEMDIVVSGKKRLSPFFATDLDFLLRQMGIKRVVLNGGMADCCVLNAAFDASNLSYRTVILRDLVRGTDEAMEKAALNMVSLHLGLVVESDDLLRFWEGTLG